MDRYAALCLVVALGFGTVVGAAAPGPPNDAAVRDRPAQAASSTADPACPRERILETRRSVDPPNGSARIDRAPSEPRIVELYPNPTAYGNVGEYLVLEVPPNATLENWTLTDGHTTAALPNDTVTDSGRVALSTDPDATRPLTDDPVRELEGTLRLAVDGDELALRNGSATVDRVAYERAPLADRWYRTDADAGWAHRESADRNATADGQWWPRGATCRPVSSADVDEATAFVLPDSPDVPLETIRDADDRLLLAGYTVTSQAVARELVAAAERGVDVRVLLESGPVGGTPAATADVLETLEDGGVDVRAIGGEGGRYRYHHAKYAVVDDRILVTSENWKPAGVGGRASRGWGVRLEDDDLAADLAAVFDADFEGWDTRSGDAYRTNATFVEDSGPADSSTREYPTEHEAQTLPIESAELLLTPDNAESRLAALIADADDELLVEQAALGDDFALLDAAVDAAERGVEVKILLDSAWYHEDDNAAVAATLERTATREDLPLEVRLVEDTPRFEKIHAKGVVIDREVAVVGSANWNGNAFANNREVLVALHGEDAAAYYAGVFDADWNGDDTWRLPIGLSATVVAALVGAALVGRRYVRFGDERRVTDPRRPRATDRGSAAAGDREGKGEDEGENEDEPSPPKLPKSTDNGTEM